MSARESRRSGALVLSGAAVLVAAFALHLSVSQRAASECDASAPVERVAVVAVPTAAASPLARAPWAALRAIGRLQATPTGVVELSQGESADFLYTLRPAPDACDAPVEGRCHAGCFSLVAVALDEPLADLEVQVSPQDDADDIIGQSLERGAAVSAGFCYGFQPEAPGTLDVRVRVRAAADAGQVVVAGFRERVGDEPELVGANIPVQTGTLIAAPR